MPRDDDMGGKQDVLPGTGIPVSYSSNTDEYQAEDSLLFRARRV